MRFMRRTAAALAALGMSATGLVALTATTAGADTGDVHRVTFPVTEKVSYSDDWLAPRAGHRHQGNDLMGAKLMHEVAVVDGVISMVRVDDGISISGNMLTLKGIYGREMYETWYMMTVMLQSGLDISPIITHRYPYTEFQTAFEQMLTGQTGKVILKW